MLTFCPTYGLPTNGPQALPGPTFFAHATIIPDLFETQQAQLRLISDTGVVSTHQVHCSIRAQDERSYPSPQKVEWVICPTSGQEMPLLRPLLIHDESKKRIVLRLPEAFRHRVPLVMRWWFEYLSVAPRSVLPSYAMQPHIEFVQHQAAAAIQRESFLAGPHLPPQSAVTTSASVTSASATAAPLTSAPTTTAPAMTSPTTTALHSAPLTSAPVTAAPLTSAPATAAPLTSPPPSGLPNRLPFPEAPSLGDLSAFAAPRRTSPSQEQLNASAPSFPSSSSLPSIEAKSLPKAPFVEAHTASKAPFVEAHTASKAPFVEAHTASKAPFVEAHTASKVTEASASPSRGSLPAVPRRNTAVPPTGAMPSTPSLSNLPGAPLASLKPSVPSERSTPASVALDKSAFEKPSLAQLMPDKVVVGKIVAEDDLDDAPPTLMVPVSEEDQRKARALLGIEGEEATPARGVDFQSTEASPLPSIEESEPATQISRLSEDAAKMLSELQGDETNLDKIMGFPSKSESARFPSKPTGDGAFDPKREQDRLSALLGLGEEEPIVKDPSEAMTRPALRGVNPVAETREDFIPDIPTVARPPLSSLAEMRQSKLRSATAIRTTVGEGISASAEIHPPKAAPADKKAWQQSGQSYWYSIDPAQQIASIHFLCPLSQSRILDRGGQAHFYLQLHRLRSYPLIMCLLAFEDGDGVLQHILACPVDLVDPQAVMFFDLLSQEFTLQINLCNEQHLVYRDLQVYLPLEQNVEYVLDEARRWQATLPANQRDFDAAIDDFQEEEYDRLGKMNHNFQQDSFIDIPSPAAARLAIGIVSYWSEREQLDYLISVKSFALTYFREIQKRVLRACIDFGIALRDHMLDLAVLFQFGSSRQDLLRKLLSNFAEANLQIRQPNDLSAADNLENWQHLIDDCDRYSIEIDSDIEELAARAERHAQEQSQQDLEAEEVDDFEVFEDFQEMAVSDLLQLLQAPQNRMDAAAALCRPENLEHIDQIASIFPQLEEQEARTFAEVFTQFGKEAEPLLLSWLHLPRPDQRAAAILALGSMRSEHAIEAIIKRLRSGDEWEVAAEALARIGESAIPHLEREVKNKNWLIRLRAVKALHKINTPESHDLLARLVNDPNEVVKSEVADILRGKR
ncbi:HEAT repeat domain-containing protein [Myxococcota bacterium]|nr:HEAT repeat domain-containing protein [Myxococcota bacterium]